MEGGFAMKEGTKTDRQKALDVATSIVQHEGWHRLSARKMVEHLGHTSPSTLKSRYEFDEESLKLALVDQTFRTILYEVTRAASEPITIGSQLHNLLTLSRRETWIPALVTSLVVQSRVRNGAKETKLATQIDRWLSDTIRLMVSGVLRPRGPHPATA